MRPPRPEKWNHRKPRKELHSAGRAVNLYDNEHVCFEKRKKECWGKERGEFGEKVRGKLKRARGGRKGHGNSDCLEAL